MAFCPPVSAISVPIGPSRCASVWLIVCATSVDPVNTTPATRGSATARPPMSEPIAGQEMQHIGRHAGLEHELHRTVGNQRRLRRRLRQHGVTGRKRRRDLARKYRERKIPRADADEHAATAQTVGVALTRRSGHDQRLAKMPLRLRARSSAGNRRPRAARKSRREWSCRLHARTAPAARRVVFEQIGRAIQDPGAFVGRGPIPGDLPFTDSFSAASTCSFAARWQIPTTSAVFAGLTDGSSVPGISLPPTIGFAVQRPGTAAVHDPPAACG